jgi:acetyltransferase-like isoleucine patch superfamily enzyme
LLKTKIRYLIKLIYSWLLSTNYISRVVLETEKTQTPINFFQIFKYKFLQFEKAPYWPVHPSSKIANYKNILIGVETSPGLMPGCYIQGNGKVVIGDYTQIGPGVGIISSNHDIYDNRIGKFYEVNIGKYCWLGMNSVILPDVTLGDFTIVGAGSIVTKSFAGGYCIIGGNPARIIRNIDPNECIKYKSDFEYVGFIKKELFEKFRKTNLNI